MNRKNREEKQLRAESLKAEKQAKLQRRLDEQVKNDRAFRLALGKEREPVDLGPLYGVVAKVPKLQDIRLRAALATLAACKWARQPDTWKPKGKAVQTIFRSLAEHLLCRYPVPKFMWSIFDGYLAPETVELNAVLHVADGGSLFQKVQDKSFPVPLTRRMCHDFLQTTAEYGFVPAIRRTQVATYGGDRRLLTALLATNIGKTLAGPRREEFLATVIQFFANNPMMDPSQVGPLLDYVTYRYHQDETFSMKGRTVLALMRDSAVWHRELATVRINYQTYKDYVPSGFKPGSYERTFKDNHEVWKVEEVLNTRELATEGRVLHHCVLSYSFSIERGDVSIWSVTMNGERLLTIEVRNRVRQIVQARGRYNAPADSRTGGIMATWAGENGLTINTGRL